jgi:hypothetical protein
MKKNELKHALHLKNVPEYYYNIDGIGEVDQKVCIEYINSKWSVYYSERGKKFDEHTFDSEEEACKNLYERLIQQ